MLLTDEQYVVKWLSQYGALPRAQIIKMLQKPPQTAEKILRNLKRQMRIADVSGGYYIGLDPMCQPDQRMILAIWVLLRFIDKVEPMAHYPAVYPSQLFFLKENVGYEIVVLYDGEQNLLKLLQPQEDMKYIVVVPRIGMVSTVRLPNAPCLFATVDFAARTNRKSVFTVRRRPSMKGETTYMKTLGKVEAKLSRMKEQAAAARWFYENGNLPESYNRALRLEELSEQTVLLTRVLPAYTGAVGATTQTDAIISDTIPVEVGFTAEGWFSIRIPTLLPKKASGSADYIRSYLYPAMRKFFEGKPPVRFRDCVLAYRHVYDRSRPERAMRDHDNIETNMVTDILALYVLPDDHPAVYSHYYCSAAGSEDRTEVYVIPKHDFPVWMVEEKTLPDKGVKLYEVRFC